MNHVQLDLAHPARNPSHCRRAAEDGLGVLVILHDINLAAMYAERIVVMKGGTCAAEGAPRDVLTEAIVSDTFELPICVISHPTRACPHVIAA